MKIFLILGALAGITAIPWASATVPKTDLANKQTIVYQYETPVYTEVNHRYYKHSRPYYRQHHYRQRHYYPESYYYPYYRGGYREYVYPYPRYHYYEYPYNRHSFRFRIN